MKYTDYEFYVETYLGCIIKSAADFSAVGERAEAYIDKVTFGRITENDICVQMAVCAVCDIMVAYPENNIISENNDGYSVRYSDLSHRKENAMYEAVKTFLPSNILYRGFYYDT